MTSLHWDCGASSLLGIYLVSKDDLNYRTCITQFFIGESHNGPMPRGMKETFNFAHSSLRNVVERSFGVLKQKWRMLLKVPSYPQAKQSQIIVACMALHNFIR